MTSKYDLTPEEVGLLDEWLPFYLSLAEGSHEPTTTAQEHFVRVTRGLVPAETDHERAFMKWLRNSLHEAREKDLDAGLVRESPDRDDLSPKPGWFTDGDWRKLRQRYP